MMRLRLWLLNLGNRHWYYSVRHHPVVLWIERVIYCHHNARVIADFEDRMSFVLWSCTKGMSKPYYDKHAMVAEIESWSQDAVDDEVAEAIKHEREACAQVAAGYDDCMIAKVIADQIRLRSATIGIDPAKPGSERTGLGCVCGRVYSIPAGEEFPSTCDGCGLAFNWPKESAQL